MDGLWSLVLQLNGKTQGCALVFRDGKIQGGDSGATYQGTYSLDGGAIKATVTVKKFLDFADAFFPGPSLEFEITGRVENDRLAGKAVPPLAPQFVVQVIGKKEASL